MIEIGIEASFETTNNSSSVCSSEAVVRVTDTTVVKP